MEIILYITLIIFTLRFCIVLFNYLSKPYLPFYNGENDFSKKVSILIPARNEEQNIAHLLQDIFDSDYPNMEILVYNDKSTDKTAEIVSEFCTKHKNIKLLQGLDLPKGWLGKNFGCHNLSQAATGDYLLFLDADVRISVDLISRSVNYMKKNKLHHFSIFPRQIELSLSEKITVPHMYTILTSLLPLSLVKKSKNPAFSAANGQFMFFESTIYTKYGWHKSHRNNAVEDIAISKQLKTNGLKTATLLVHNEIECRMYNNYSDAVNGFSKNFLHFFGNNKLLAVFYWFFTFPAWLMLFFNIEITFQIVLLGLLMLFSVLLSKLNTQPVLRQLFLRPFMFVSITHILIKAIFQKQSITWKGRKIHTNSEK